MTRSEWWRAAVAKVLGPKGTVDESDEGVRMDHRIS